MSGLRNTWPPSPDRVDVDTSCVHVWRIGLDVSQDRLTELRSRLSPAEEARARRCRLPVERDRFVVGRAALRDILSRCTGVSPGRLLLVRSARGRPRLAGPTTQGLDFNLSHSAATALLAVARDGQVGIDVEVVDPALDHRAMATRFLGADEAAAVRALPDAEGRRAFFTGWTRREAYAKANDCRVPVELEESGAWNVWDLTVGYGVRAALVAPAPVSTVRCWTWQGTGVPGRAVIPNGRTRQNQE
ncbi:4'-phosphopantetheinyl transferase superfamily protein [Streptomyces uncialis]|uniref:4'-phosphopantetheinyl transferase family protein n=1 Tax=Streptomyces uncialis TaxID=1048205 RepID=UPI002E3638CA|nr:4'-phosphopantetheinyl transferase superfamily protein [Streptomyces uncialis]